MNSKSDNIRNLLLWLFYEFDPTFSPPSGNGSTGEANSAEASLLEVGSDATSMKPVHQKGSEETSSYPSTFSSASLTGALQPRFSAASRTVPATDTGSQTAQSFNFGEIQAVQERFQALLKQRLLLEYESKPPLFPWELEVSEYPAEVADGIPNAVFSPVVSPLWSAHMGALKVPGLLPAALMNTLLERCQKIALSPIKQGVRLVKAVEDLFPESSDMLEPIANMVLVPAYRSGQAAQDAVVQQLANAAGGYESALPEQQIALSMLAAQEILGALTFSVSADKPCVQRSWITTVGALDLTVSYEANDDTNSRDSSSSVLKVVAVLPDGGRVSLCDGDVEKLAVRSRPGTLDLTLAKPAIGKTYVMEVSLLSEAHSLNFAIHVDEAPYSS